MLNQLYKGSLSLVAATGCLLGMMLSNADARLILTLDDLATSGVDVIVIDDADGSVGDTTAAGLATHADGIVGDGAINFSGGVGNFVINITTGISKPFIGSGSFANLDLNSVTVTGWGDGEIEFTLTDTDFLLDEQAMHDVILTSRIGGTTQGTVEATAYLDQNNNEFGMGTSLSHPDPFEGGAFSSTMSENLGSFASGTPFSLTTKVKLSHSAFEISSFDHEIVAATPEPGTILLLTSGLVGIIGIRWRRTKCAA